MRKVVLYITVLFLLAVNFKAFAQGITSPVEPMAFYYEEVTDEKTSEKYIKRTAYAYSAKLAKDEEGKAEQLEKLQTKGAANQQNQDIQSVAAWMHYYDQLEKWQKYISQTVFRRPLDAKLDDLKWKTKEDLQNSVNDFFTNVQTQAKKISEDQKNDVANIVAQLEDRADKRVAYREWLNKNKTDLEQFTNKWEERKRGKSISMDGYNYLISDKPLEQTPRDYYNVVSPNGVLTPYDFLDNNGSFKKPKD